MPLVTVLATGGTIASRADVRGGATAQDGAKGGAEINHAMERGEVHGRMQYWSGWTAGKPDWLRDNKLIHFVQYGPTIKELADVPSLKSLVQDEKAKQMITFLESANKIGIGFWVPPETSKAQVGTLRKAFEAMMASQEFQAMAKRIPCTC